jgi:hypothetical protein
MILDCPTRSFCERSDRRRPANSSSIDANSSSIDFCLMAIPESIKSFSGSGGFSIILNAPSLVASIASFMVACPETIITGAVVFCAFI